MVNSEFEVIAATDCRNGNCPTVWRSRTTGTFRVRGKNPQNPSEEIDVDIPAADWSQLAPQLAAYLQG